MMVGDSKVDIDFAQNLGIKNFIGDLEEELTLVDIDLVFLYCMILL